MSVEEHRQRYLRSCQMSGAVYDFEVDIGPLVHDGVEATFEVKARGQNWATDSQFFVFDHGELASKIKQLWMPELLAKSFCAGLKIMFSWTLIRYFQISWRFGVFFLYPFAVMILGAVTSLLMVLSPIFLDFSWVGLWLSVPLAAFFLHFGLLPFAETLHTRQSLALWALAVDLASLKNRNANALIEKHSKSFHSFFEQEADQYQITTFSLGAVFMIYALGAALEEKPELLQGKKVVIVTLGGQGLQCSLIKTALELRRKIRAILAHENISWVDIQCLTDIVNLHGGKVARDNGVEDLPEPKILEIRMAKMLTRETYRKYKWDALRVHRQFVYGSEKQSRFDFALMTSGPFDPRDFAKFNENFLPPLDSLGAPLTA